MSHRPLHPDDPRVELDRLAEQRRWSEIRDRVAGLDDGELMADAKLAYGVAEALMHLGDMDRALPLVLAAESQFRAGHDHVHLLPALNLAGAIQFELGDLEGAEERFSDLLELARERGDDEMSGRATNNLGAIAALRGDYERALSLFRLCIPPYQKVGFLAGLAQTAHNLGIVHRDLGYWREAESHYQDALRRARQLEDERLAAMARVGRAEISHLRGDAVYAMAEARHALQSFVQVGDELGRADALRLLAAIAVKRKDWQDASSNLQAALRLARTHANPLLEAEILQVRADLHAGTGQVALTRADREAAAAIYRRLGAHKRQEEIEPDAGPDDSGG